MSGCMFCGYPKAVMVCGAEECQRYDRELGNSYAEDRARRIDEGLKAAFRQRCKEQDNYELNRLQRWFYVVKLFVCVALDRHHGPRGEQIEVALVSVDHHYSGWSSESIEVGSGLFRNWHYELVSDGECTM